MSNDELILGETLSLASEIDGKTLSTCFKGGTTCRCKVTTAGVGYSNKLCSFTMGAVHKNSFRGFSFEIVYKKGGSALYHGVE